MRADAKLEKISDLVVEVIRAIARIQALHELEIPPARAGTYP